MSEPDETGNWDEDKQGTDALLTLEEAREILGTTEPMGEVLFATGKDEEDLDAAAPEVSYGEDWVVPGVTSPTQAWLELPGGGQTFQLTFQAAQQVGSLCRINKGQQLFWPPSLLEQAVNWALAKGLKRRDIKLLTAGYGTDQAGEQVPLAVAQARGAVEVFSNLKLLDVVSQCLQHRYGVGEDKIRVDYKLQHDLEATAFRVIALTDLPYMPRESDGEDMDRWYPGVQVRTSVIGLKQTIIDGYLWFEGTTGGVVDIAHSAGGFARRGAPRGGVYEWAAESVTDVIKGLDEFAEGLQPMAKLGLGGPVSVVLEDLFAQYSIPKAQKTRITETLADEAPETIYELVVFISRAANLEGLRFTDVENMLETAGHLIHTHGRCTPANPCGRLHPINWHEPDPSGRQ